MISHEKGKADRIVTTNETQLWSSMTLIFQKVNQVMMTSNLTTWKPWFSSFLVSSNPLSQENHPDRNHKIWNIWSNERFIFHMQVVLICCYTIFNAHQLNRARLLMARGRTVFFYTLYEICSRCTTRRCKHTWNRRAKLSITWVPFSTGIGCNCPLQFGNHLGIVLIRLYFT